MYHDKRDEVLPEVPVQPELLPEQQLLLDAAAKIRKWGWVQYRYGNFKVGFCALGALGCSPDTWVSNPEVFKRFEKVTNCNSIRSYNDTRGRTKEEVLAALEAAARL